MLDTRCDTVFACLPAGAGPALVPRRREPHRGGPRPLLLCLLQLASVVLTVADMRMDEAFLVGTVWRLAAMLFTMTDALYKALHVHY